MTERAPITPKVETSGDSNEDRKQVLRALLKLNASEETEENNLYQALFAQMQADAPIFADTMQKLGAHHDIAMHTVQTRPPSFFYEAERTTTQYRLWVVRKDSKYGGSETSLLRNMEGGRAKIKCLGVTATGQLALPYSDDYHDFERRVFDIRPDEQVEPSQIIERAAFDVPDPMSAYEKLCDEWIEDMEKAAHFYIRRS